MAEQKVTLEEPTVTNNGYELIHSKSDVFYPEYERKSDLRHQTH